MSERAALTRAITALVDAVLEARGTAPCPACGHVPGTPVPAHTRVPDAPDRDGFLTRDELAARYDVPVATVEQWAHKGTGPPYIIVGRYARYRVADVLDWERARPRR